MNIISFSVWGNDPFYVKGIKENIELAEEYYPGWKCKIYYDNSFDLSQIPIEVQNKAIFEYIPVSRGEWDGLFWRFYPASDPDVDILIVRDLDSRLNSREAAAVKEWLESPYDFHAMRDHLEHNVPIMGGMWGCRNGIVKDMMQLIGMWKNFNTKGTDQNFLAHLVWPFVRNNCIVHDRYSEGIFISVDKRFFTLKDVKDYNPYDFCGDEKNNDFPKGRIILNNGTIYKREEVYEYFPKYLFGNHNVKPFPSHSPMKHGACVGDYIK